ncbi:hypothetical protein HNQ56_001765 [Anaerotaenia torta]|uniref:hypothetical protein n=1 Tax=Anaerotaenia torta TaxID=433293 RepID=UPI003D2080C4
MKVKILDILGTGKRRVGMIALSAALVLTFGTTTALAANAVSGGKLGELFKLDNGKPSYSVDGGQTWNEGTPEDSDFHYSLDGGETWNEGTPPAGSEQTLVVNGEIPDGTDGDYSVAVKNVDGAMQYSTDGGKTWSSTVPDGFHATVNPDGSVRVGR